MDLVQEVFLKGYQNLAKLDDAGRFGSWLFRIAHNEAFSLLRRRRPESDVEADPETPGQTYRMFPVELAVAVNGALAALSDDQRDAVVLKIYEGFKFEEMAEILGCPVSTVKSRLYAALDLLKDTLAPIQARSVE